MVLLYLLLINSWQLLFFNLFYRWKNSELKCNQCFQQFLKLVSPPLNGKTYLNQSERIRSIWRWLFQQEQVAEVSHMKKEKKAQTEQVTGQVHWTWGCQLTSKSKRIKIIIYTVLFQHVWYSSFGRKWTVRDKFDSTRKKTVSYEDLKKKLTSVLSMRTKPQ